MSIKALFQLFLLPKERLTVCWLFLGVLVMSLLETAGVASIAPFMAVVTNPKMIHTNPYLQTVYQFFYFSNDNQFLIFVGLSALVVLTVSNSFSAFMIWRMTTFANMQGHRLANRILKNYLYQPYLFFLNRNSAELGKNILTEVDRIINGILTPGMQAISKLITACFIFIFLIVIDPVLSLCAAGLFSSGYLLIFSLARKRLHSLGEKSTEAVFRRFKTSDEAFSGIKDIKLRHQEGEFQGRFSIPSMASARYQAQALLISQLPRYALETIAFGGILSIVVFLISRELNSEQIVPLLALYALAGYRLMPAFQQIYQGISSARYHFPVLQVLGRDLQLEVEGVRDNPVADNPLQIQEALRLRDIEFSYSGSSAPVLNKLNLEIRNNTTVGFVGGSGGGKTTLVDVILGLLVPQHGELSVDGTPIDDKNRAAWQKNLGYVPQTIYLTDDTIECNIAFGVPRDRICEDQVRRASKLAELDEFIQSLPEGFDTPVGERGVRLSGGQRQRIGIARALYHNPEVLVLDEATSALDGVTESAVMDAIHNLTHKMTIIIIAHRLGTVKQCDEIHLIEKGVITQSGSYDYLLAHNQKFREMAQL